MRLATWNVNSVKARLPRLLEWLDEAKPDVLCLQEIKTTTALFPEAEINELGYEVAAHGEGRWNGVALLSSVGLEDVSLGFPGQPSYAGEEAGGAELTLLDEPVLRTPEARAVGATCGGVRVWSLYAPNGRTPESAHYAYKLEWFAAFRTALEAELGRYDQLVACGDFNVAPTDGDVWDPAVFVHSTHVTPPERQALADLLALGLTDVIPKPMKGPHPFTYWDYRAGAFAKDMGMRIDLVYASQAVAGRVTGAYVDREARKGKGPSDHAPVVVDLDLQPLALEVGGPDRLRHAHAPGVGQQLAQLGDVQGSEPGGDPLVPHVAGPRHHEHLRPAGDQRGPLLPGEAESQPLLVRRHRGVDDPPDPELHMIPDQVLGRARQPHRDLPNVRQGSHYNPRTRSALAWKTRSITDWS